MSIGKFWLTLLTQGRPQQSVYREGLQYTCASVHSLYKLFLLIPNLDHETEMKVWLYPKKI